LSQPIVLQGRQPVLKAQNPTPRNAAILRQLGFCVSVPEGISAKP